MKDARHHLKGLQRKILQGARKIQVIDACTACGPEQETHSTVKTGGGGAMKKKTIRDKQLGKSFPRMQFH